MKYLVDPIRPDPKIIRECAERLRFGQLGVLPTETVYGLAALMHSSQAVAKIYLLKERDRQKPCAVAVWDPKALEPLVQDISEAARELMETFWPGPLTLVFRPHPEVPDYVTRGIGTVAIRMPDHEVFQSILRELQEPLVLTSANLSGQPSVFTAEKVGLLGADFTLDAGETDLRRESTVIDVTQDPPHILRKGVIDADRLQEFGVFS